MKDNGEKITLRARITKEAEISVSEFETLLKYSKGDRSCTAEVSEIVAKYFACAVEFDDSYIPGPWIECIAEECGMDTDGVRDIEIPVR